MSFGENLDASPRLARSGERAMQLAIGSALSHGTDIPVGAVALRSDMILGEGIASDQRTGDAHLHAEVDAIRNTRTTAFTADTLVTTMEPCSACQDFISTQETIEMVAYILPRDELVTRNLVNKRETIHQRHARKRLPFDIVRLDQPQLYRKGLALLDNTKRDIPTGVVTINKPGLLEALALLDQ